MKHKRVNEEKVERNIRIFCDKEGLEEPEDYRLVRAGKKEAGEKITYRELIIKYDLCQSSLQNIVNRLRERYA